MARRTLALALLAPCLAALPVSASAAPDATPAETAPQRLAAAATAAHAEPAPVRHKVVAEDRGTEGRRVIEVSLERRAAETELMRIAGDVKARGARPNERTIVNFHLGTTKVSGTPWAVARFKPDTRVLVIGLRLDEEERYVAEARADKRNLVGVWLTSSPLSPGKMTIYRESGRLFAEWRLRGGQVSVLELAGHPVRGNRLTDKSAKSRDNFVLLGNGELEVRDGDQSVGVAERVSLSANAPHVARPSAAPLAPLPPASTLPLSALGGPAAPADAATAPGPAVFAVKPASPAAKQARRPVPRRESKQTAAPTEDWAARFRR